MLRKGPKNILKFLYALDFLKNTISKCKLRLLKPLKQPHLKMKMFFERETLNPNIEKYLVKTRSFTIHTAPIKLVSSNMTHAYRGLDKSTSQ